MMKVVAKPIDVLAWFDKDGIPNPVRFRTIDEAGGFNVIKVDRVIIREKEKLAGNEMLKFQCQSNMRGTKRQYELKYELKSCKWMLFKI